MLKILKKTWKDEGALSKTPQVSPAPSLTVPSSPITDFEDTLIHDDIPNLIPDIAPPFISHPKRTRDTCEPDVNEPALSERPSKLFRTGNPDSLRNRLPEILNFREREEIEPQLPILTLKEQICEQAKHQNTIADLPHAKSSTSLVVELVTWAVEQERQRPKNITTKARTLLIIVEDLSVMEKYTNAFETDAVQVSVGKYTEEIHRPELETWSEILKKDVVMAPSHLLLDSLIRGALAVTQLHFMVVLDAQSIKNQDSHSSMPIVQIMNDFYRVTDQLSRPRVFALASPPSDRRSYFDSKMLKLELTLDAKVFGVTDEKRAEILALPDRPNEIVILYDPSRRSSETRLLKQLHQIDPTEDIFRRHYRASQHAHEEVGPCASDLVWRRSLKAITATLMSGHEDIDEDDPETPTSDRIKLKMYKILKDWSFTMPNLDASSKGFNVSHKFLRLIQVLRTFKSYGEGFRGIIFVQRRAIALVLVDLLRTLDDRIGFLRPQAVVGSGHYNNDSTHYQKTFHEFATGVCNLLIATKSIEDLDIPKASVVIRYDLFESQISHAYVRARTRGRESHLVHMVERGNDIHRRILSRITNLDADMLRWTEVLCNSPGSSAPPQSLRETINPYHSESDGEDEGEQGGTSGEYIQDPTTGGRIYLQDATTVVYRYASRIQSRGTTNWRLFEFEDIQKEFGIPRAHICSIDLPDTPINRVFGDALPSKAEARRSACFKACEKLYKLGLLDCQLVPLPYNLRAQHEYERNKNLEKDLFPEIKQSGTRSYRRKLPTFWENIPTTIPSVLYPTIVYTPSPSEGSNSFGPIVILTREPLPSLHSFRLFFSGIPIPIHFQKALPIQVDEARIKDVHAYTVRICRTIMNKALVCYLEEAAYFFLPLPTDWQPPNNEMGIPDIVETIPWDLVSLAGQHWAVPIKRTSAEDLATDLQDAIVQDRFIEFTRRYKVAKLREDLTPLSKPTDSPRESNYPNLFEFCKAKRKGFETLTNFNQPIIEVSKVQPILNHLNPTSKPPSSTSKSPARYLIPELCAKFTIPASTLWTAMLLPSIMRRIDDLLLVKELDATFFDHAVREDLLHNAICTPSAGLEYDYERLELLGDAFLKYLSSIYVFVTSPSLSEGSLHVVRQKIISNKSLLMHSTRVGLPAYIQSKIFPYKSWHPPNFRVYAPLKTPKETENKPPEASETCEAKKGTITSTNMLKTAPSEDVICNTNRKDHACPNIDNEGSPILVDGILPLCSSQTQPTESVDQEDSISEQASAEPDIVSCLDTSAVHSHPPHNAEPSGKQISTASKKKGKSKKKKTASDDQGVQWLGDKAIADVAEAIIGAAYITGGRETALQATKALTIPLSNIDRWSDFGRKVLTPPPNMTAKLRPGSIAAIEKIIGHRFNRPHLLGQAMTHSSIQGYESTSYERLEFIGDAILDFMVIRHIFDRDQHLSPGALTMLKGAMVSNSALAAVCVWSGLQEYLLFESNQLSNSIQTYANELKERQEKEYALAAEEGRPPGQYWLDTEPPKALSDVVESIIGAIYISDNFSPVGAESLFDNVLKPFYDKHITLQTLAHHPTKILFELFQAQGCQQFEITKEKDKDENLTHSHVLVHEVILASAEDISPTSAGRMASLLALDALEGDADFMTRTCDCRTHLSHKKLRNKSDFERALEKAFAGGLAEDEEGEDEEEKRMLERFEFERALGIGLGLTGHQGDDVGGNPTNKDEDDIDERRFEGLI